MMFFKQMSLFCNWLHGRSQMDIKHIRVGTIAHYDRFGYENDVIFNAKIFFLLCMLPFIVFTTSREWSIL